MLLTFIGTRGTQPSSGQGTMSFIIDNKILFDINPEFVIFNKKFNESWINTTEDENLNRVKALYGKPSFSKLEHIFISHFHYDHWGGLRHLLIWIQMFDNNRANRPLNIYISKESMEIFKNRISQLFRISTSDLSSSEFFLRYLLIEIDSSIVNSIKIHEIASGEKIEIGKYIVEAFNTSHMLGSVAFKLIFTRYKLIEDKLEELDIPKGPLLSKIQKEGKIIFNKKEILDSDIFLIEKTILGYSSDTQLDKQLLDFFKDTTILIHESSYFTDEDDYHTDVHSSLDKLLENVNRNKIKLFLPVHFSNRYKWEEIVKVTEEYNIKISEMRIFAPKFGDIIHFDEKSKNIVIKSLELTNNKY